MKIKILFSCLLAGILLAGFDAAAQTTPVRKKAAAVATEQTDTFQVLGNCGMCKKTIETAAKNAGANAAFWDGDKDLLTVQFDPAKTSTDAIQKAVAQSGYDNVAYKAPDAVYEKLHECCHYDRSGRPATAKSCEIDGSSGN